MRRFTIITVNGSILKNMASQESEQARHTVQTIVEETPGLDYLIMDFQDIALTLQRTCDGVG